MLALTKKTDYALIALSVLAKRRGCVISAREVAGGTRVPLPILMNILKTLAGAGIVVSERGVNGGYSLARGVNEITLFDLINVIEGPFHLIQCLAPAGGSTKGPCDLEPSCPIRLPALRVHDRMKEFLRSVTLAEIVEDRRTPVQVRSVELEPAPLLHGALKEIA